MNARVWTRVAGTAAIALLAAAPAALAGEAAGSPPVAAPTLVKPSAGAQTLIAHLSSPTSSVEGKATYGPTANGSLRLVVKIVNAEAFVGQELQVSVSGLPVGTMKVGPDGRASLRWPQGDVSIGIYFTPGSLVEVKQVLATDAAPVAAGVLN